MSCLLFKISWLFLNKRVINTIAHELGAMADVNAPN